MLPDNTEIVYIIDGENRRVGRFKDGDTDSEFKGLLYQDALRPVAELGSDGQTVVSRFVYGSKFNVPDYFESRNLVHIPSSFEIAGKSAKDIREKVDQHRSALINYLERSASYADLMGPDANAVANKDPDYPDPGKSIPFYQPPK